MKKNLQTIIAYVLTFVLCLSLSADVFAFSDYSNEFEHIEYGMAQTELMAYSNMSEDAKKIYDMFLALDPELLEYHRANIDPLYEIPSSALIMPTAVQNVVTTITNGLAALSLPTPVSSSLKKVASSMAAAQIDGPLPVADILLFASAADLVYVLVENWYAVAPLFDDIVNVFTDAFSADKRNVSDAFSSIEDDTYVQCSKEIDISGTRVVIRGARYDCNRKADELTKEQTSGKKYFVAILYDGEVMVAPDPIESAFAKLIIALNHSTVGVWATSASYARGICGNDPIFHVAHGWEGYYPHYHHRTFDSSHAWFMG